MKALVFTPTSLSLLMDFEISPEWFKDYYLPPESHGLKRIIVDDIAYIIDQDLDQDEIPIVVVNLSGNNPVFIDRLQAVNVIDRIDTVARSIFTDSVQVPVKWVKYHHESLASIYASPKNVGVSRLNYDTHPNREKSLFILSQIGRAHV